MNTNEGQGKSGALQRGTSVITNGKGFDVAASGIAANPRIAVGDLLHKTRPERMSIAFLAPADGSDRPDGPDWDSTTPSALSVPDRSSDSKPPSQIAEYDSLVVRPGRRDSTVLELQTVEADPDHPGRSSKASLKGKGKTAVLPSRTVASEDPECNRRTGLNALSNAMKGSRINVTTAAPAWEHVALGASTRGSSPSESESSANTPSTTSRTARAPRPAYSEEQKFFIMYMRIVLNKPWSAIEDAYIEMFGPDRAGQRSKGGLTSVYYRIRRNWGLEEVLQTSPDAMDGDKQVIEARARHFSEDFLTSIGYPCRK